MKVVKLEEVVLWTLSMAQVNVKVGRCKLQVQVADSVQVPLDCGLWTVCPGVDLQTADYRLQTAHWQWQLEGNQEKRAARARVGASVPDWAQVGSPSH